MSKHDARIARALENVVMQLRRRNDQAEAFYREVLGVLTQAKDPEGSPVGSGQPAAAPDGQEAEDGSPIDGVLYQTRQAKVLARRFETRDWPTVEALAEWCKGSPHYYVMQPGDPKSWFIAIPGTGSAHQGDWIAFDYGARKFRVFGAVAFANEFEPASGPCPEES